MKPDQLIVNIVLIWGIGLFFYLSRTMPYNKITFILLGIALIGLTIWFNLGEGFVSRFNKTFSKIFDNEG